MGQQAKSDATAIAVLICFAVMLVFIAATVIIILVKADRATTAPCTEFSNASVSNIPARCIKELTQ